MGKGISEAMVWKHGRGVIMAGMWGLGGRTVDNKQG
jgi:hypothetical protein